MGELGFISFLIYNVKKNSSEKYLLNKNWERILYED